jgi:hypothetical protein
MLSSSNMTRTPLMHRCVSQTAPLRHPCRTLLSDCGLGRRRVARAPFRGRPLHAASRRPCHVTAQHADSSAPASTLLEPEVTTGDLSAPTAATSADAAPVLDPVDVCETHTLHVAVGPPPIDTR